jgi:hypothetical protein
VATSIQLSSTTVSFSSLLATHALGAAVLSETGAPMSGVDVTWSTLNGSVATVSPAGVVTAAGNGSTQVRASGAGLQADATINVQQVPFTLEIAPDPVDLIAPLDTETVTGTARDAGGSAIVAASLTWTSRDPGVATVDDAGLVSGVATGQTRVVGSVPTGGVPLTDSVTVSVGGSVLIVTTSLPDGVVGSTYSQTLTAVGGDGTYVWSLASGALPDGLDVAADGTIGGTPTTAESSSFTVQVMSDGESDTQALSIAIVSTVELETVYLVGGYPNASYSDQIGSATGGDGTFTYAVTAGGLPAGLSINANNGTISGISTTPGVSFFEITASSDGDVASATYAITISTAASGSFNLWIAYEGGALPPANTVTALNLALARWEEVVFGEVGNVTYPPTGLDESVCGLVDATMLNGAFIDDMSILMTIGPIDGPSNTLARGGPCGYGRGSLPAAITGQMQLDQADAAIASAAFLQTVVFHEIGHALGIGTLWSGSLTEIPPDTTRYVGVNGNNEWRALGTAFDGVPVQPTLKAHWDEAWFDSEIMTPSSEGPAGAAPVSRVTIGALLDLGWTADLTAADPYSLPGCAGACTVSPPGVAARIRVVPFDEVVVEPLLPLPK